MKARTPVLNTIEGVRLDRLLRAKVFMEKRVVFKNKILPYFLVAPQIIITLVFFIWPAFMALYQSVQQEDAFWALNRLCGAGQLQIYFYRSHLSQLD